MAGNENGCRSFHARGFGHTAGLEPVAIRYVLVRDLEGKLRDEAFGCDETRCERIQGWRAGGCWSAVSDWAHDAYLVRTVYDSDVVS